MEHRPFGPLGDISALTLGGGGIGQVWGKTTQDEAVATIREAVSAGITWIDVAPSYKDAENVVGLAFQGQVPPNVRISTKCVLDHPAPDEVLPRLESSLANSLKAMRLESLDLFLLHGHILPDNSPRGTRGVPRSLFVSAVRPAFEKLKAAGRINAWGISGVGIPSAVIDILGEDPLPSAVQAVSNLLGSIGGMKRYEEPARPRDVIAAASRHGVGVMGIRAVQAGALTEHFDRPVPENSADMGDYHRAAPFRRLAKQLGESPASLAHRYALSMQGVSTVVLGVKNRDELHECLQAEAEGTLSPQVVASINQAVE